MKYIRTKDGRIIKIGEQTDISYEKGTLEIHNKTGIVANYEPIEVLKYTDTIEELCDEFVWIRKNNILNILPSLDNHKYDIKTAKKYIDKFEIYGAIWTDKGLIYVAKMNDKGVLELL